VVSPVVDGFGGCRLRRSGTAPSSLGENEQARSGVAWIATALDVSAFDQVRDELGCGLLCDPEMLGHVGRCRVTGADTHESEPVGRSNIIKPTARQPFLHGVDELAGKP